MYDAILFDLDGTLLSLQNDQFIHMYFKALAPKFAPLYQESDFIQPINAGTEAMMGSDGQRGTLREVFAEEFNKHSKIPYEKIEPVFINFYQNEFNQVRAISQPMALSKKILQAATKRTEKIVLATVPVFPRIAIEARLSWVGLEHFPFTFITSFENMHYCKPNPKYYQEIAECLAIRPRFCLMIGNDRRDDLAAAGTGMDTYLLLDEQLHAGAGAYEPTYSGYQQDLLTFLQG